MKKNCLIIMFLSVLILLMARLDIVSASPIDPISQKIEGEDLEINIVEVEESQMVEPEIIEKMIQFVEESAEQKRFASLHIDREEDPSAILVFSFTEEPSTQLKEELQAIASDEVEVKFHIVQYTEKELMKKQREVDQALFEEKMLEKHGIQVSHTGIDVINNKLEIGILPFNEENVKVVSDYFPDDMIEIVEGMEFQPLVEDYDQVTEEKSALAIAENDKEKEESKPNIIQRFFQLLSNLLPF